MAKKKKCRRRAASDRVARRYRILLHTGQEKEVGEAQWRRHLDIGNLVRQSADSSVKAKLAEDVRLALPAPGLIAFEDERTGALAFETRHRFLRKPLPGAPEDARSNYWAMIGNLLYREPTLHAQQVDGLLRSGKPLIQLGSWWDEQGEFVLTR